MSYITYKSLMSMVNPLTDEGYTIALFKENGDYRVEIKDSSHSIVATGRQFDLIDALEDAFVKCPKKTKELKEL